MKALNDNNAIQLDEFLQKKEVNKIKDNYIYLKKINNILRELLINHLFSNRQQVRLVHLLLIDLKKNLSAHIPSHLCIEQLEQGLLKIYWYLKLNQDRFTNNLLADKIQYLIESENPDALNFLGKYGSSLRSKPQKSNMPNIAEIKYFQHKGFGNTLKKIRMFHDEENPIIRFFKQCLMKDYNEEHEIFDLMTYLKRKDYHFGDIDLLNLDKLTPKDKARLRIIIKTMIEDEKNLFIKEPNQSKLLEKLFNPLQLERDEKKFPFICRLQRFMIDFSPSHLTTSRRDDFIGPLKKKLVKIYEDSLLSDYQTNANREKSEEEQYKQEIIFLSRMRTCISTEYAELDVALKKDRRLWPKHLRFNIFIKNPTSHSLEALESFKTELDELWEKIKQNKIESERKTNELLHIKH